jgi:hypothetical protein
MRALFPAKQGKGNLRQVLSGLHESRNCLHRRLLFRVKQQVARDALTQGRIGWRISCAATPSPIK